MRNKVPCRAGRARMPARRSADSGSRRRASPGQYRTAQARLLERWRHRARWLRKVRQQWRRRPRPFATRARAPPHRYWFRPWPLVAHLSKARTPIWRTRSRETPNSSASSLSVIGSGIQGGRAKRQSATDEQGKKTLARDPFDVLVRAVDLLDAKEQTAVHHALHHVLTCPFRKSHPAWESYRRVESSHDLGRCSRFCIRSQCSVPTCSSRGDGLKSGTCFFVINSVSP